VQITVTSGELDLDGYLGAPAPVVPAGLGNCGGRPALAPTASDPFAFAGAARPTHVAYPVTGR
jgi:hypothetical protein